MDWRHTLFILPGILIGLTVHECCHALCAWKLGDNTARDQGRITLNPLKHIDILGFIFLLVVGFGWAKPVQFNPENLKNYRRDRALIAAAGPLSNFLLGIVFIIIAFVTQVILYKAGIDAGESNSYTVFFQILYSTAFINFVLFVFNLIPFPPLDGSHIVFSALNLKPEIEMTISRYAMPALMIVLLAQNFLKVNIFPIGIVVTAIMNFFINCMGNILRLFV